jgi:hypothetical protein
MFCNSKDRPFSLRHAQSWTAFPMKRGFTSRAERGTVSALFCSVFGINRRLCNWPIPHRRSYVKCLRIHYPIMKSDQMVDLLEMGTGSAVDSLIPFCGGSHSFDSVPSLKVECVCVVCPCRTAVRHFETPVVKNMVCLSLGVVIIQSCGHVRRLLLLCRETSEKPGSYF